MTAIHTPKTIKLFYAPGACSLSVHIALREAGHTFTLERLDFATRTVPDGRSFWQINPKGYVPAIELDDGTVFTEGAIIVQLLADMKPDSKLAPPLGSLERARLSEWMHYIATELHKGMSPLYNKAMPEEIKDAMKKKLGERFDFIGKNLEGKQWIMGDTFTVADGYAFYCLRSWQKTHSHVLTGVLADYYKRVAARPQVKAALDAEKLEA